MGRQEGTVVADRRKMQKNHIRAARDWLGQAEHSLDHENDVQGDLKLMLARAELSKVQPSPRGTWFSCWGLRLMPPVLALSIAFGGFLLWQQEHLAGNPAAGNETVLAGGHKTAEEGPSTSVMRSIEEPSAPQRLAPAVPPAKPAVQAAPEQSAGSPRNAGHESATVAVPRPPAPSTQKLMQSAGKILRQ